MRHGDAVAVLVGSACPMHARAAPEIVAAVQGRYGRVMDADQAESWAGPSSSIDHTVFVRYSTPVATALGLVRGGWYAPFEVFPIDAASSAPQAERRGMGE